MADGDALSGVAALPLGQDQDLAFSFAGAAGPFSVVGFVAHEAINAPFEVAVDLVALLDKPAVLRMLESGCRVPLFYGLERSLVIDGPCWRMFTKEVNS